MNRLGTARVIGVAGALCAIVGSLLPWVTYQNASYSGAGLAGAIAGPLGAVKAGGLKGFDIALYLVPTLAAIAAGLLLWSARTREPEHDVRARLWAAGAAVIGLCIALLFLASALLGGAPGIQFQPGLVRTDAAVRTAVGTALGAGPFVGLGPGIWLVLVGFAVAAAGALLQRVRGGTRAAWRTQDYVLLAILAMVFGAIYWAWLQPYLWVAGIAAQAGQEALFGLWFIAGLAGGYIIRRPGAALLAETLAAFAEILLGAPAGPILLITGFMQALGVELVFAATGYRSWGWRTMAAAGVAAALVALPWNWLRLGYFALDPGFLLVLVGVRVASGAAAGLLGKTIADLIAGSGSLNAFAISRERVREV